MMSKVIAGSVLTLVIVVSGACSTQEPKAPTTFPSSTPALASPSAEGSCDSELWKRVYDPSRLEVIADCKVATGTIAEKDENEDGDTHMLLTLDPGQEELLNKRNLKKKDGNLVVEVVCANAISDKKAKEACTGYSNKIFLPNVGDKVKVTGSFVLDSHNGWNEIHPVSSIELVK